MGLLRFVTGLVTLPVKIAALPVRTIEKALDPDDEPGLTSESMKKISDLIEEAARELEDDD